MTNEQQLVKEFMLVYGQDCPKAPVVPDDNICNLRLKLIQEELDELDDAMFERDIVSTADALADLLYVVHGTAVACGLDMEKIFEAVHTSNMSKLWSVFEVTAVPLPLEWSVRQVEDKYLVKNAEGKVVKPPSFRKPQIEQLIK